MAHHTFKNSYTQLITRLNRASQGAPPSDVLYKILEMLFSRKEAELVAQLPIRFFTAEKAAKTWRMDIKDARRVLDRLSSRAILLDVEKDGRSYYCLPPPMAGFFEFSMMRTRDDINQKVLSELFYQYINVEEDFVKSLVLDGQTQAGRFFVHEPALSAENALYVLDYERASRVIQTASHLAVGACYCRHKMHHLGRACDAPMETCMTFNLAAASLIKHRYAKPVSIRECMELLETAYERKLVQFGENVRQQVNFICNCCGCCCEAMIFARKYGMLRSLHTNFLPEIVEHSCNGCGNCVGACPVKAMSLVSVHDPRKPKREKAKVREELCLGCGICTRVCPAAGIRLRNRDKRVIMPLNSAHRTVVMAIERGTLQHLIFDNYVRKSHRVLAAVLGVILRLPTVKQLAACKQINSRFLEALIERTEMQPRNIDESSGFRNPH
jgi:ferredoxin